MIKDFDGLYMEGIQAAASGWDSSYLRGRMIVDPIPWDYRKIVIEKANHVKHMLEIGTGRGELLSSLPFIPQHTCATSSVPSETPFARQRLEHLGIQVFDASPDRLPFEQGVFELVINRHEAFEAEEVGRVTAKNGMLLTEQVGALDNRELNHFFGDHSQDDNKWRMVTASIFLNAHGFKILDQKESVVSASFMDIGAIVYFIKMNPRQFPAIDLESNTVIGIMKQLHDEIQVKGPFKTKQHRFMVFCRK